MQLWKNFNNENNFPIYSNDITRMLFPGVLNVLFFGSMKHLSSQVNLVAIRGRLCKLWRTVFASCMMHAVHVSVGSVWNKCVSCAMCETWEPCQHTKAFLFMTEKLRKTKKSTENDWKQMGILKILWLVPRASLSPASQVCMHTVWLHFICTISYLPRTHQSQIFFFSPSGISLTCGSQAR